VNAEQQNCEETAAATTTIVEEITINQTTEITMADTAVVTQQEAPQAHDETEHHPTNDEIEEYEESQRKFRELWEKKREKVSLNAQFFFFIFLYSFFYTIPSLP
jgi:hypothetical protein